MTLLRVVMSRSLSSFDLSARPSIEQMTLLARLIVLVVELSCRQPVRNTVVARLFEFAKTWLSWGAIIR